MNLRFKRLFTRSQHWRELTLGGLLVFAGMLGALSAGAADSAQSESATAPEAVQDASAEASAVSAVSINSANAQQLAQALVGVGARKAEAIVRYREQFGPFGSIEELTEVQGIGVATLERNRAIIRLD